ncbi:MAG: hypothetical protein ABSA39_20040 [Edaphobacter sp.]
MSGRVGIQPIPNTIVGTSNATADSQGRISWMARSYYGVKMADVLRAFSLGKATPGKFSTGG